MKQTEITKTKGGWLKHLLLLCVTLLGVIGFATAAPNYPFPNNYAYPYGSIYTGSDVQTKIQTLYTTWLSKYYVESGSEARIKFVQGGEDGSSSVSEGIAYGMLIMVYMDNATNNTQAKFDKLWAYYKANSNSHGVMNWKVNGFTHQVTAPVNGNSNGATDADLDAAQALLMAYKQWGKASYLTDAQNLIQSIWAYEVNSNKQLKPGDMFDDYKNPCYFITNAMNLFDQVKQLEGWSNAWDWTTVADNCYTLMSKVANASTGLIPDWCYENGTLLTGIKDSKFESIFGYDAVRIPWRMAHAYAWYGDSQAHAIAKKITTWAKGKYPSPNDIVDGYFLDGRAGDGTGAFTGSLSSWGTSKNACFKGGLSIGSMVDPSFASYMSLCWQYGAATDSYGAYYTHTTQLLFMLCLTGNMPNFWDMLPVYLSSKTDASGSAVVVNMSKPIDASSASSSKANFTITTYPTAADTAAKTNGTTISVSSASVSGKVVTLNLSSEIADPYIFVTYNGTSLKGDDGSQAAKFTNKEVTNVITNMEPYPTARYSNQSGNEIYIQWSKDIKLSSANASDFTVKVDGVKVATPTLGYFEDEGIEEKSILALKWSEAIIISDASNVTVSYAGGLNSTSGTKKAKAFTDAPVQNFYGSETCMALYNYSESTGTERWEAMLSDISNKPSEVTQTGSLSDKVLYFNAAADERLTYAVDLADDNALDTWLTLLESDESRLVGRIFVKSLGDGDGLALFLMDEKLAKPGYSDDNAAFPIKGLKTGEWFEFDIPLSTPNGWYYNTFSTSKVYQGLWLSTWYSHENKTTGNMEYGETPSGTFEIYVDYIQVCPKKQDVVAERGKVSFDGSQVELKFATAMKVPTDLTAIKIKEGSTVHTVTSIEAVDGDATKLLFTLAEPITSAYDESLVTKDADGKITKDDNVQITASLTSNFSAIKSVDGRPGAEFEVKLANLLGMTTSTGWYDDFADANDYVTKNISSDGTYVAEPVEKASSSQLDVTWDGSRTWAGSMILSTTGAGYVMDLTGNGKCKFKVKADKSINGFYRIDAKDYFGNEKEGTVTAINLSTSYKTVEFDLELSGLDKSAIAQVTFRFFSAQGTEATAWTPTLVNGTLSFDEISIGKPLYLYDFAPAVVLDTQSGIDEDSQFTVKSSVDGYIFVVRETVNPQYSAMAAATKTGLGTSAECTAGATTTIDMTGLGYGYFTAYAYDPVTGSVSSKYGCQVKDVTPPVFTDYYSEPTIPADGTLYFTVDEDATVMLFEEGSNMENIDAAVLSYPVQGGDPYVVDMGAVSGGLKSGVNYYLRAVDGSGNFSTIVPKNGIMLAKVALTFTVDATEYTVGETIKVEATRATTAFLVPSDKSVNYKRLTGSSASNYYSLMKESNAYGTVQFKTDDLTIDTVTTYYVYVIDDDMEELVGPSALITITPGTYTLNSIELDVEALNVNAGCPAKKVFVTFDEAKFSPQTLTFSGCDFATVEYDESENTGGQGTIYISATEAGTGTLTIASVADPTIKTTLALTATLVPAEIELSGNDVMSPDEKQTLTATILPIGATTDLTWKSSNGSVATVSGAGVVEAEALGTTTITVTAKTKGCDSFAVGTFDIEVKEAGLSGVKVYSKDLGETEDDAVTSYVIEIPNEDLDLYGDEGDWADFKVVAVPSLIAIESVEVESDNEDVVSATVGYNKSNKYYYVTIELGGEEGLGTVKVYVNGDKSVYATIVVKNGDIPCTAAAPTASDITATTCESVTLTATATGTAVWYDVATGGTPIASTNLGSLAAGNYTYYVANNDGTCESARTTVKVTVKAVEAPSATEAPAITATTDDEVTLTANLTSGTAVWYSAATGGTALASTKLGTLEVGEYTYYVARKDAKGCESTTRTAVKVTVSQGACKTPAPTATEVPNVEVCEGDAATLTATFSTTATAVWYSVATEGTALFSGNSYATGKTAAGEYTYYVAKDNGCESVSRTAVTLTINPKPTATISEDIVSTVCESVESVTLAATPATGTWSGTGVSGTKFIPKTAGAGKATLTYTIGDPGCQNQYTKDITVVANPTIDLSSVPATACAGEEVALTPTTGTWIGTGVDGTTFSSTTAGSYELTYSETNASGCTADDNVTITVIKAAAPTVENAIVEINADVTPMTATASGTINWYESETGASIATGTSYSPSISTASKATYTYYVSNTQDGCESEKVAVTLTVTDCLTPAPSIADVADFCEGETATLTATGTGITWYNVSEGGTALGTGATLEVTEAGTYYASQNLGSCESARGSVKVSTIAKPAVPTATGASSCSGAELVAMTTVESADWYADKSAAALATASKSYTPTSITETTTYYVNQVVNGCASDFAEVVYTVKVTPAAPTANSENACLGTEADYKLSATGTGLQWYDATNSLVGSSSELSVSGVTTAKDYTFTVTQTVDGCTSEAATATLTVNALPTPSITVGDVYCDASDTEVELTATPAGGDFAINGTAASSFVPKTLGDGTYTVTYSYTDANGCTGTAEESFLVKDCSDPAVTSITLNKTSLSMREGDTYSSFNVTILPEEGTDNKAIAWKSSNESVATVNAKTGEITAVKAGVATITCYSTYTEGMEATCEVEVMDQIFPLESATFAEASYELESKGTLDLSSQIEFNPSNAIVTDIAWNVISGGSYAEIASTGILTAGSVTSDRTVKVQATITYLKADGTSATMKSAAAEITILKEPVYVSSIAIASSLTLEAESSKTLTATVLPANADDKTYTWSIKSGDGGSIDPTTGELTITGSAGDSFVVVATANDIMGVESNECVVKVVAKTIPVASISTDIVGAVEVTAGEAGQTLTISFNPSNTTQTDYRVIASSTIFSYVDNGNGMITITGNQGGTATLTIRSESNPTVMTTVEVKVTELVKNIMISGNTTLNVGSTAQMTANVGESTATNKAVVWSSSDETVAKVSATGLVTALAPGMVQIIAEAADGSGVQGFTYVTINTVPVVSLTISDVTLQIGESATIKATISPANATFKDLTYTVADNSVASVDNFGNVTAYAVGSTTVTVTAPFDNVSKVINLTVTPVKADKEYLIKLIDDKIWGAYSVYDKVLAGTIQVGWAKGQVSPLVYNEFQAAWLDAQDVRYEEFATQEAVDAAAKRLYEAIVAMGADPDPDPSAAVEDVEINATVYPTFVNDVVTVEADGLVSVMVVSVTGKVVASEIASGDVIEIVASEFAQGAYKVLVQTENGVVVKSFIKK